ncbi:hypothetical protein OIU84_011381 [Salix udensis]|uniref:F-box domain-containing protein n=1 Tax=Salix udensis TaxID=889485 RepID=A0AAD6JMT4_9ROSI|nr:hypothetical protein OIU84_011381 [Salix udensis]
MPTLVNYSGDDEIYSGGSFYTNPSDLGRLYSTVSHVDNKRPSIEVLPDECLFEIFKRVPEGKERSSCARVSKKWLMLLSSIRRSEFCNSNTVAEEKKGNSSSCL